MTNEMKTDRDKLTFTLSLLKQQKGQFASNDQSDRVVGSRSGDGERDRHMDLHSKKKKPPVMTCSFQYVSGTITMRQSYLRAWRHVPKSLLFATCSVAF